MLGSFLNIFRIPELRKKVMWTVGLLMIYRIGAHVPTPFINPAKMKEYFETLTSAQGGGVFGVVDMFSGGAFSQMTVFALGIMPYISASIILQLLTIVWPRLERISKEGEAGRKKITQWTRYGTVVLSLFQGLGIGVWIFNLDLAMLQDHRIVFYITTAITMAAGTCFLMWLGEKISEYGIGNGISLIIAVSILSAYPGYIATGFQQAKVNAMSWLWFIGIVVIMVLTSALIVLTQEASRKIPVQHARRMAGRRVMQGGSTFMPLKLNTAGVIPIIFSSAIMQFPAFFIPYLPQTLGAVLGDWTNPTSRLNPYDMMGWEIGGAVALLKVLTPYTIIYAALTAFFCYFYTALTFNPVDLADNLRRSQAFIPGKKPGKPTSDFINYILVRITVIGAATLIFVSLIPQALNVGFSIDFGYAQIAGGTGLIIIVGVVLDTMKQIESQLLMRHYDGFTYRGSGSSGSGRRVRR